MGFVRVERILLGCVALILIFNLLLIWKSSQSVDWAGYAILAVVALVVLGLGCLYRSKNRSEAIASTLIATAIYVLFTMVCSVFNYLLLPVGDRRIDWLLVKADAALGFDWLLFLEQVASVPFIGVFLGYVYLSTLPQLAILIIILGLTGRTKILHKFLVCGAVCSLLSVLFWYIFPSTGPSTIFEIPEEVRTKLDLVVDKKYGDLLNLQVMHGVEIITPSEILGLIAFPSMHIVMAFMSAWYSYSLRLLFPLFLAFNFLMIPATIIHGGHHVVDLFGGAGVFAVGVLMARLIVDTRLGSRKSRVNTAVTV